MWSGTGGFERRVPVGGRKSSYCLMLEEFQELETPEMVEGAWALGIIQMSGTAPP